MKAKKIPPGGGTPSGAYQAGVESSYQQGHSTTSSAEMQEKILRLLRVGEANALTLRDLTRLTESDGRRVREAIRRARLDGVPIVSGEAGYWLAATASEKARFTRQMRSRAREILRVARAVEAAAVSS